MSEVRGVASRAATEATHAHVRLDAQTQLLMALRETQVEQGKQMRDGFTKLAVGQELMTQLLTDHINSCDLPEER